MIPLLPIGTLKREEIYTFLGGLHVALAWILFFSATKCSDNYKELNLLTTSVFLITWLSAVVIVYLLISIISILISLLAKKKVYKKDLTKTRKILGLGDKPLYHIGRDYFDQFALNAHISSIIFVSILLTIHPLLIIVRPIADVAHSLIFWVLIIAAQFYLISVPYLFWRKVWAFNKLHEMNIIIMIDSHKFLEELAKHIAVWRTTELGKLFQPSEPKEKP